MEATSMSIGKSVLNGALSYAKSAVADEVALQLGVHRDKAFVTDELEMMQSFLMVAHDERDDHGKVVRTWVKQVRDVAYDVEDGLQDFVVRLQKQKQSWWRIPRMLLDRRHVATQMKELRTKVEDVSQRNLRYGLIKGSRSAEPAAAAASDAMFGVDEARHAAKQHQSRLDLAQLINKGSDDLGVVGVWGTSGSVGHTSIIWEAYENAVVKLSFPCRAWVRVTHPFHPKEFIQSIVKQFRTVVGVTDILLELEAEKKGHELALEYDGYVNKTRYLIVLTDLSTIEEWQQIKACFPENKLGSRIVVSTEQVEVASLSPGQDSMVSELKQLSVDQTIYAFYNQSSHDATNSSKPASSSRFPYTAENEIVEDQSNTDDDGKMMMQERLTRANTMSCVLEEFQLIGRGKEKSDIIELIREQASTEQFEVIALWGMGGLGKTTLVKDVQQSKEVRDMFGKHAFVTVLRPFKLEELLRTLAVQLDARKGAMDFAGDTPKNIASMGVAELTKVLVRLSEGNSCLIVLDDLSSTAEWDLILPCLFSMKNPSLVVVITTRREDIAKHCCKKSKCIRLLNCLEEKDACFLLTKKVFKNKNIDLAKDYPELVEPAKLILKRCNGLPLAIVTIGGFLADQPTKTAAEWRKLIEHISVELEMNPKLDAIKTVLMKSYDGLPYYLKSCFLYFSIYLEDRTINRRRLACRWIAEGYAQDMSIADQYFMELVERSMILPTRNSVCNIQGIDSCQLHDLIRDISIAKSMEENLVFRLEEGCRPNTHGAVRHLAISSNWQGDKYEFESIVELSCIRSLTVFGKWKPFYMSDKMRFLRVLDLEGTEGLEDHHMKHIGKLLHLRYLSLRGCLGIRRLPKSVGNLSQLETLDIKYASVEELPKTITKLTKLRYVHASRYGVKLPRGMKKLKTLHTLLFVDLGRGNVVVQEIKGLTSLRKLGVWGMNKENGLELCSAISSSLSRLEYLSVNSDGVDLSDCFHDMFSPPENLQCLKLWGEMSKFPGWIKGLQNLVKLKLGGRKLPFDDATMQALGNLPNLSILAWYSSEVESITFPSGLFRSLVVLELGAREGSVNFVPISMPKLEVLKLVWCECHVSGLEFLPSIKEAILEKVQEKEDIVKQLASNQNRPIVKLVRW
uniref:Uncharacterized protein n=1 Tax=Avena sativa TaxID=4498 RepID=A0ACD5YWL9_AVESA